MPPDPAETDPSDSSPLLSALRHGQAAAARLGATAWSVEVDEAAALQPEPAEPAETPTPLPEPSKPPARTPLPKTDPRLAGQPAERPAMLFPSTVQTPTEAPPSPLQIVEAMLFVGGPPLTADKVCSAVRGLTAERVRELIDELTRKYRRQNRPYTVQPQGDGYSLAVKPQFRAVREKLYGGPKEARLSQPALDTLSLIAYRQPLSVSEVEALRGADSAGTLRQLVRLGLIAVTSRGGEGGTTYGTTPRFLELFHIASLDDLPRLGE